MSAYTDAQRAEAIALVEGCVLVSEVRARLLPVIAERDALRNALAAADVREAWLVEEVTQQTGASVGALRACMMGTGAHRPVVNVRMGDALRQRIAAEIERDEVRCLLFDLVVAAYDTPMTDSPAWKDAGAYLTGARVSDG